MPHGSSGYTLVLHAQFTILATSAAPPEKREAARKVAGLTLLVALIGVVMLTTLTLLMLRRMRRRSAGAGRARRTRHTDAWAEAGRRAGSPPAEAFEADRPVIPDADGNATGSGPLEPEGPDAPSTKPGGPYG